MASYGASRLPARLAPLRFFAMPLLRRWTAPAPSDAQKLQRRAQELLERNPDAPLPDEMLEMAALLGIDLGAQTQPWRAVLHSYASSAGEGLLWSAKRWLARQLFAAQARRSVTCGAL